MVFFGVFSRFDSEKKNILFHLIFARNIKEATLGTYEAIGAEVSSLQ